MRYDRAKGRDFERYWQQVLMRACGAVLRAPQRLTPLNREEEKMRAIWTWRSWDEVLYLSMGSDREWLRDRVLDDNVSLRNLSTTCVLMSDQIPFWVNVGRERALYTRDEVGVKPELSRGAEVQERWTQKVGPGMDEAEPVRQTRQMGKSEEERCRITLEVTQCLTGLFDEKAELKVMQLKPILVFSGGMGG